MDFLEEEIEEILNIFREESEEQIQKLNHNLLKLENSPKNGAIISELFRDAHSLKGAARMIGLNDIQSVAHKIEDIFGMARDETLEINAQIIDTLCKAVDYISSIIEESIATRGACHSVNVDKIIEQIEEIKKQNSVVPKYDKASDPSRIEEDNIDIESIIVFYKDTMEFFPKIKACLEQLKFASLDSDTIIELHRLFTIIDNSLGDIHDFKIVEPAQDLKIKLDGVAKGSGILLDAEVTEIEETFNKFLNNLDNVIKHVPPEELEVIKAEIQSPSQKEDEISMAENEPLPPNDANNNDFDNELREGLDFISNNLVFLSENSPEANKTIDQIVEKLQTYSNLQIDENIKKIFGKVIELALLSKSSDVKPGKEIVDVIRQSYDTACIMLLFSPANVEEDPELIIQRLAILYQMLKLSEQEIIRQDDNDNINVPPVRQGTDLLIKNERSEPQTGDNSATLESTTIKTLRVDTKKLDQLVSQVGELIIAKIKAKDHLSEIEKIIHFIEDWYREWNKIKQIIKYIDNRPINPSDLPSGTSIYSQNKNIYTVFEEGSLRLSDFITQMNSLYRTCQEDDARLNLIVSGLEERIKSVRVLPLATIFHMFPRMVRDMARENNKEIELIISGSETSVDKKIIEEIKAPLMHIIRNSIDHGIEPPEIRIEKGKPPIGKIYLSASHLENSVLIEITDDGQGIDIEAIKRKVLQKELLTQAKLESMNDEQIINIIFWPGFSTGEIVTDISGRGVGLDIVHTKIAQLEGKVSVKSIPGQGCRVYIQLPVTMSTIKSFLVRVKDQTFAIPTSAIKTAMLVKHEDIFFKEGRQTLIVNNKTVPIVKLSQILELPDYETDENKKIVVIVIQSEDVELGFIIDKLLGDQEILHKNLTPPLLRVRNVAGVSTLGSGELCLILNVNDLVKSAYATFGMPIRQITINNSVTVSNVKKNILVVDDSITTRILERNILRAAGYNVSVAVDGLDALTKIAADKYDIIVSDIEMPEINGFELTEKIRQDLKNKNIPIILVSSLASELDKKKGINLGANAYITKGNFDQGELLSTIRKLI